MASVELGGILSRLKPKKEAPRSTTEVIEGVEITHTRLSDKLKQEPTAFSLEIPTEEDNNIVRRPINVGDEVKLPRAEGDSVEIFISAQPSYPQLAALKDPNNFEIIELEIKDIKSLSPSRGAWFIDTISGKGDSGLTDHALSPNDKKIRFSSYGFNNKFTELKHKSKIGPRVKFEPNPICIEPSKPRQLFPNTVAARASA